MTTLDVGGRRAGTAWLAFVILGALCFLAVAVAEDRAVMPATAVVLVAAAGSIGFRFATRWHVLVNLTILVILFIPIKRYKLVVDLPFDLEPYRIVLAVVFALWLGALLADRAIRLRSTPLDPAIGLFAFAVLASVVTNPAGIVRFDVLRSIVGDNFQGNLADAANLPFVDVSTDVVKSLLFLASFFMAFYLVAGVIRTPEQIESVVKTLVVGGAVVAAFALYEGRTGYNVFDHLQGVVPLLDFAGDDSLSTRAGRLRVLGSAQHPIALASLFVILVPLSLYLVYRTHRARWWVTTALLSTAALATVSRTAIVMAAAIAIVFGVLRPAVTRAALPFVLPFLVLVHFVSPGAIGGIRQAFFPSEGIVEDQTVYGGRISSNRLDPQFDVIRSQPAFGQGYGTRVTAGPNENSRILDDQWLGTAVETGLVGIAAWVWIFVRFIRRAARAAREDDSARGWLLTALAASTVAFAVGMLTFDAFSFIQVTFVLYVLLALGCSALASPQWSVLLPAAPLRR